MESAVYTCFIYDVDSYEIMCDCINSTTSPLSIYKMTHAPTKFPILAAAPSHSIFSRRLLGRYTVTLMRQVSGCAPSGEQSVFCFFPFVILILTQTVSS